LPVGGVDLDQRVDELLARAAALVGGVEDLGQLRGHHVAVELLHDVEGRADDRLVLAHGEDARHADEPA